MKTDDIFEALTDIDDKFIANAHPSAEADTVMVAAPAPKKPMWRTLVPIAASIAVLCAAGVFGAKYYTERLRSDPSESGSASFNQLSVSAQNVMKIDIPDDGSEAVFTMEEFPEFSFRVSNKAVTGVLKTPPEIDIVIENSLFDDTIGINDLYLADLNGDGKRELCASVYEAHKGHGIMVNDFSDESKDGTLYTLPTDENFEYSLAEEDGVLKAVKTVWQPSYSSTIPNELSRETLTLDMMTRMNNATEFKKISIPRSGVPNDFPMEEFPKFVFTATHNSVLLNGYEMNGVDNPIISGDSIEDLYLCDLNGDGNRELCATVINNGIRSVVVEDFMNSKQYTLQGVQNSMYRHEYNLAAAGNELKLVERHHAGDLLVSDTTLTLEMMTPILSNNATAVTKIDVEKKFKPAEFPDKTFEVTKNSIFMSDITTPDAMIRSVINGMEYYLTDLNGDDMREIISWGSIGSGIVSDYIEVYDIANDERYMYVGGTMKEWLSLDVNDGALYAVTRGYQDNKETSRKPLSLDILKKVEKSDTAFEEVPLVLDQTFTMEDFPGFSFTVDTTYDYPQFTFNWNNNGVSNHVNSVYLCDIDGDGKREIALNCPFAGNGCIRVYGFMDNGEMGEAVYFEDGGCWLNEGENGALMYYTNDKIEPFIFSKSDLKPTFAQNYFYQLLDWDHTLDFTEILPELGAYDVTIEERTLKISRRGGETIFDSGIGLQDLYSIPDMENNSVVLLYITESVGGSDSMVGAVKLSEKSAVRYDFEKGVSIKPITDELLLVNADGIEEPFKFPESGTKPLQ